MVHFFAYLYTDIVHMYIFYTEIYAYVCLFMYIKNVYVYIYI